MFKTSLYDLLKHSEKSKIKNVLSFSQQLDMALGSGIPFGHITEFVGCPGTGKTQICLQLCVNVQIPSELGGPDGHAVFIDTRMGFNPSRFREIGTATVKKIQHVGGKMKLKDISDFNMQKILNGNYVQYVDDYKKLMQVINSLKDLLKEDDKIKLIVIDSFSFLFKFIQNSYERRGIIYETISLLQSLVCMENIAVVITNQMTTKIEVNPINDRTSKLIPSLGESHSHQINQRVILYTNHERNGHFIAKIVQSICKPRSTIEFQITESGIK